MIFQTTENNLYNMVFFPQKYSLWRASPLQGLMLTTFEGISPFKAELDFFSGRNHAQSSMTIMSGNDGNYINLQRVDA